MMTLRQLKAKYSGQTIPDWELVANGLKQPANEDEPKRRGRPPKVEEPASEGSDQ